MPSSEGATWHGTLWLLALLGGCYLSRHPSRNQTIGRPPQEHIGQQRQHWAIYPSNEVAGKARDEIFHVGHSRP